MHVNTENSKKQTQPSKTEVKKERFKQFSWMGGVDETKETALLGLAKDVAVGVGMALALIEKAGLDEEDAYLNAFQCGALERFSIASCNLLNRALDEYFEHRNRAAVEGK